MKNKLSIYMILILITALCSCEKDYNQWEVDPSYERLFKSIVFEVTTVKPTAVELKFTKSVSATKYIFEFSKDSLEFKNIVNTVEVLADTLKPFASSSSQTRIEYRTLFDELDGTTGYSVRMKSIDATTGLESKYNQLFFRTPAEEIFKGYSATSTSVTLKWTATPKVTKISLYDETSQLIKDFTLSKEQIESGTMTIEQLANGTAYTAKIFNAANNRGTLKIKTTGIANSTTYKVLLTDTASSINTALQGLITGGAFDITVEFAPGTAYNIGGEIMIPAGVKNIAFIGSANADGNLSSLSNVRFKTADKINNIIVQNLNTSSAGNFFLDFSAKTVQDINIEGCTITQLNSIVRVSGASVINSINVNNCLVSQTGGYGVFNVGAGGTVGAINMSNSTLTEISTRFADVRVKTKINFSNITCVNVSMGMGHLWNFDNNNPVQVTIQNCIIAGANGAMALNSTSGTYSNITISYVGNYKTKDVINGTRPLTGIVEIPRNMEDFFVNAAIGDFHIKPGIGFAGTGVAGDPRWF